MAGAATCLFRDLDGPCNGDSSEHVIQQCIGGTLESDEVLCDRCNHHFGDVIDPPLCEHFEPIVTALGVVARAQLRRRQIQAVSIDGNVPLRQRAGGVVELPGVHREHDAEGDLVAVAAPPAEAHLVPMIAAREAPGEPFTIRNVPVTDLLTEPLILKRRDFGPELRRAVAKTLLEVADEYGRADGGNHFRRAASLDPIRRFIRLGAGADDVGPRAPIVPLGEEFERAVTTNLPVGDDADHLSTRVAVVYDTGAGRLFGLLSVAGTMPFCVSLARARDWGATDWSLLVRRGFPPGPAPHAWIAQAVLTWRDVEWAAFPARTLANIRHARCAYNNAYADAVGRAVVYIDTHDDQELTTTLQVLRQARGSGAAAVVEALKLRFLDNGLADRDWQEIRQRLDAENLGADDARARDAFRRELAALVALVGVPRMVLQLGGE